MADNLIYCMICRKVCFKGWTHNEIVAGNVAEVEWNSTPETLQATLRATVSEAATRCNNPMRATLHAMLHRAASPLAKLKLS